MSLLTLTKDSFFSNEEVILSGSVTDPTVTLIEYGGNQYPLTDSNFSFNLGTIATGTYEIAITLVDGDSASQIVTEMIEVVEPEEEPEVDPEVDPEVTIPEEELPVEPSSYVADYVDYAPTDLTDIPQVGKSGFEPIEDKTKKFPERRNIQVTHPDPDKNQAGLYGSFAKYGASEGKDGIDRGSADSDLHSGGITL